MILPIIVMILFLIGIAIILMLADHFLVKYGECKITINKEKDLYVQGGGTLLSYLTEKKIFIPSACGGKGTCGHCKLKVLSGAGVLLPTEEIFITREESHLGIRLACQVKVRTHMEIYIPEHLLFAQEFNAVVEQLFPVTYDIKFVRLKLISPQKINFKPGQYIQIKIPGTDEFRAYSIASSPSSCESIELIVRLVKGGLCSTYVHEVLDVGDNVQFIGPFGEFFLREESKKDILFIGGGCGMAPIRSIILTLAEKGMPRKAIFFFGARAKRDLFFTDELRELESKFTNFKYIPALSEPLPTDEWDGEFGLITDVVEKYMKQIKREEVDLECYLCGPPPMIDAAIKILPKYGITLDNILYDKF